MRVAPFSSPVRFALLGPPALEPHFPARCGWATARFVPLGERDRAPALDDVVAFAPDVVVVADPHRLTPAEVAGLPGIAVGMVIGPLPPGGAALLRERTRGAPGAAGFDFFTWFEEPPAEVTGLPVLQVIPPPVDVGRCLAAPRLDLRRALVPAWARPPQPCLDRLRALADVAEIPAGAAPGAWPGLLAEAGTLVYWSRAPLGGLDPLPLLALANGLLLLANTPFPKAWGIERDDEYLVAGGEEALVRSLADALSIPEPVRAVRVRAWQKVREAFSADSVFHKLVHDALLLGRGGAPASCDPPTESLLAR